MKRLTNVKKKAHTLFSLLLIANISYTQVGINNNDPKATLDIVGDATTATALDGIIAPRITGDQLRAKTYTTDQNAALIYVTAADSAPTGQTINVTTPGYYIFDGSVSQWKIFGPAGFSSDSGVTGQNVDTDSFHVGIGSLDYTSTGGAGEPKLFFDTSRAYFAAGVVTGDSWDSSNRGIFSTSFGANNISSGSASFTAGQNNIASGTESAAIGLFNTASDISSIAMGGGNTASGEVAVALGFSNESTGDYSFTANRENEANGNSSTAFGAGTLADTSLEFAIGTYNTSDVTGTRAFVIGNGSNMMSTITRSDAASIYQNGNMTIAGTLTQSSDKNLKKDITPLESSLEKIDRLNGYSYYWKSENRDPSRQIGVIAQEVKAVYPELVTEDSNGNLAVNYSGLIPVLIESIKELKEQNILLKKELELLKNK